MRTLFGMGVGWVCAGITTIVLTYLKIDGVNAVVSLVAISVGATLVALNWHCGR